MTKNFIKRLLITFFVLTVFFVAVETINAQVVEGGGGSGSTGGGGDSGGGSMQNLDASKFHKPYSPGAHFGGGLGFFLAKAENCHLASSLNILSWAKRKGPTYAGPK